VIPVEESHESNSELRSSELLQLSRILYPCFDGG